MLDGQGLSVASIDQAENYRDAYLAATGYPTSVQSC
jgi:hypothetical protein